jgi:hypothetical protein
MGLGHNQKGSDIMTTIAYRSGVLAADTMLTVSGSYFGRAIKIFKREKDNALAGSCGNADYAAAFSRWFLAGKLDDPPKAEESDKNVDRSVIFLTNGEIWIFEPGGKFQVYADYFAFGSGMDFALGAMHMGADARQAIEAACKHDPNTGGDITVLRH